MSDQIRVDLDDDWFDRWSHSRDAELAMQRRAEQAQQIWEESSRKRTGRMSENVVAIAVDDGNGFEAWFEVLQWYSPFQEFGTQDIEGQNVFEEIRLRMES